MNNYTIANDIQRVRRNCRRSLSMHRAPNPAAWLAQLAESDLAALPSDVYGEGGAVAELETQVAALLGKEAALFVTKGVIAQLIALRIWADQTGRQTVVVHPKSHLVVDELNAVERVLGLRPVPVGLDHAPFTRTELERTAEPLGAVTVELPLRRVGFKLPVWDELVAIADWCRSRSVPLHVDGARLWETTPYYARSCADIAALADSIYVSFYKGLGGLSGAMLAGSADFIAQARIWRARLGGVVYANFPYAISALDGLHAHLPHMPAYYARACEIAAALDAAGLTVTPNPPQTNGFHLFLPGASAALEAAHLRIAEAKDLWFFNKFYPTVHPTQTVVEFMIGNAVDDVSTDEIVAGVHAIVEAAASAGR